MELIIISDKKMKIMLTEKELNRYNINSDSFSMSNDAQRHAFRRVLNDACKQSGFESKSSRLMVQMYPSKKGGCEIFVTRIEGDDDFKRAPSPPRNALDMTCYDTPDDVACFSFDKFSHLNTVCKQLIISKFSGKSSIYISTDGTYYLVLSSFPSKNQLNTPYTELSFITEFAKVTDICTLSYVEDYCKKICSSDAVLVIGNL